MRFHRRWTFTGDHIRVEGAAPEHRPTRSRGVLRADRPGSAGPVAAKYSDVYLTWGEPLGAVGGQTGLDWRAGGRAGRKLCSTAYGFT
ncbi:F420-dependent glucose-6-phosphate dehydrogenase Fgd2 domain protein [Mycobacterium kansasii 662]|uniref:F420-dependent glucose-6-phosphate dehydrogenase Fgd2 domain protein n=1 Tax=Mycobacterium kansasii 662 TaxID=1299326 RepID=X7XQK1_MYCKA|nr:F420-dependent glucose-6-phosphate dehydrogenase Fgd2 domain protein [Mycobacterium kansasii 662]